MKKIILIGDSIRVGYDKYVKQVLSVICDTLGLEKKTYDAGDYHTATPHGV